MQFHSITPSIPVRHLEPGELQYEKARNTHLKNLNLTPTGDLRGLCLSFILQCRSKVSYHPLTRRDSRLERQDSGLARALQNWKYGCLNFSQDFN